MDNLVNTLMDNIQARIYAPLEPEWKGALAVNMKQLYQHRDLIDILGEEFTLALKKPIEHDLIDEFTSRITGSVGENMIDQFECWQLLIYYENGWEIKFERVFDDELIDDNIFQYTEAIIHEFISSLLSCHILPYDCL